MERFAAVHGRTPQGVTWARRWALRYLPFFTLALLYLWLWGEPQLLYHAFGTILPGAPVFSTGDVFFRQAVSMPAGPMAYVSGFLSQGCHHPALGALVFLSTALGLTMLCTWHLAYAGVPRPAPLTCIPAILLLIMVGRYTHPLPACLTVSTALLFSLAFEKLPLRADALRISAFCVIAALGYVLMGAGGVFVFTLMTVVYSIFLRRQWSVSILAVPAALACIAGLAEYVYLLPRKEAFLIATPWSPSMTVGMKALAKTLLFVLYAFVPATVTLLFIGKVAWGRTKTKCASEPSRGNAAAIPKTRRMSLAFARPTATAALPLVLLTAGLVLTCDRSRKDFLLINACARQQQWTQLLAVARRLPKGKTNVASNHDINRALYHAGRLPYEMFSFPQNPHALLLTHEARASSLTELQLCETFFELGNINTAQKMASELLAVQGNLPAALEKLALIGIIKDQPETARVYLNVLKRDLIYRTRACRLLAGLDHGLAPDTAAYVEGIRSCAPVDPYGTTYGGAVEDILTGLLERNPRNQMAFEYLMACYLLTRQLDKVIANMDRLSQFGYDGIPTYYEEAMLIHCTMQRRPIDPAELGVSAATYQRYRSFLQVSRSMQAANQQAVMNRLIREFGSSYFFYYGFGRVGVAALADRLEDERRIRPTARPVLSQMRQAIAK